MKLVPYLCLNRMSDQTEEDLWRPTAFNAYAHEQRKA